MRRSTSGQSGRRRRGVILPAAARAWVLLGATVLLLLAQGFAQAVHERVAHHRHQQGESCAAAAHDAGSVRGGLEGHREHRHPGGGTPEHHGCATCVMLAVAVRAGGVPVVLDGAPVAAFASMTASPEIGPMPERACGAARSRGPPSCG